MSDIILTVIEDHTVYVKREKHIDGGYLTECGITEEEVLEYIESDGLDEDEELLQGEYDGQLKSEAIFEIITEAETMDKYEDYYSERKGNVEYHFEMGGLNDK